MYQILLALLTAKFSQARRDGLQQLARSLSLQVADETEAQALVEKLQEDKVTDFIKNWRKEVDSEVTRSTKTYEDNLKQKYDLVEKKKPAPIAPKPSDPNDIQVVIAQAVKSAVEPLQTEIASLKSGKTLEIRKQVLQSKLEKAPQAFRNMVLKQFDKMQFKSEEDFDAFVSETENDIKTLEQESANNGLSQFPRPNNSNFVKSKEVIAEDIKAWAKKTQES